MITDSHEGVAPYQPPRTNGMSRHDKDRKGPEKSPLLQPKWSILLVAGAIAVAASKKEKEKRNKKRAHPIPSP